MCARPCTRPSGPRRAPHAPDSAGPRHRGSRRRMRPTVRWTSSMADRQAGSQPVSQTERLSSSNSWGGAGRLLTQRLDWRRAWRTSRASCTRRSRRRRGPQAGTMMSTSMTPWTRSSMSPLSTSGAWAPASECPLCPCMGQPCQSRRLKRSVAHITAGTIPP